MTASASRRRELPRRWWLLGPIAILIFLVYPIQVVAGSDPDPLRMTLAVLAVCAFAALFLWLLLFHRPLALVGAPVPSRDVLEHRMLVLLLAGMAVVFNLSFGQGWMFLFFYVNIAAGTMLFPRDAYLAIVAFGILAMVLGWQQDLGFLILPTVAIGLWATAFVNQVAAVTELKAAREELARLAVSEERLRFSRDLHDLLGHSLSLITLKTELAGRLIPTSPERAGKEIGDAHEVARRSLQEVRGAVSGYRQPTLADALAGAAETLEAAGISCVMENQADQLPTEIDQLLAWSVREGATNVLRHSRARRCEITIRMDSTHAEAEVIDDGRGNEREPNGHGSGLPGLAERVSELPGATFEAGPIATGGFRLLTRTPLPEPVEGPLP